MKLGFLKSYAVPFTPLTGANFLKVFCFPSFDRHLLRFPHRSRCTRSLLVSSGLHPFSPMGEGEKSDYSSLLDSPFSTFSKQFEDFNRDLESSGNLQQRIRAVAVEIDSANRLLNSALLLIYQSRPLTEVLAKAKAQIKSLKELYSRIAKIYSESPGQYYRFHGDWRSETQTTVSLLSFLNWLETGALLSHEEAQKELGMDEPDFGLDVEDYLIGLCLMSNEMPRYVVKGVMGGDYDCPGKVLGFLTDLHSAFRMLNLRNDMLRRKFDGMKYDLRKVEEVNYDVNIRGLSTTKGGDVHIESSIL